MSAKTSNKKRGGGFSSKKLNKFVEGKSQGLTDKAAKEIAGYGEGTNPLASITAQLTLQEKFAQAGMGDDWYIEKLKEAGDAVKKIPLGQGEYVEDPDWTNRNKALELYAKSTDKLSPIRTKNEVDITVNPFMKLTPEQLKKLITDDEKDDRFLIDVTPEGGDT